MINNGYQLSILSHNKIETRGHTLVYIYPLMEVTMELFNKEKFKQVNPDNLDLLEDYLLELEAQGKSVKTIYQYKADIKGFLCWVVDHKKNKNILELKRKDFRNFFLLMQRNHISHARINRFQSSIRNLLEYAVISEDYDTEINQMAHIKGLMHEPVRKIIFLTDKDVDILIDELMKRKHYQKALFVSLAYDSVGRKNELAQVKKTNFLTQNETNTVIGKEGKKFKLLYFQRTKDIAKVYFKARGEDDVDSLWYTVKNGKHEPLAAESLYSFVNELREILKEKTGKDINLNVHSFRHSGSENYTNGTHHSLQYFKVDKLPLDVMQIIMHHSNVATTQKYLADHSAEKVENALGISLE